MVMSQNTTLSVQAADLSMELRGAINSATGTQTRVARVRAEYPNQLDYSGFWQQAASEI